MTMPSVDTNVLLRILLNDNEAQRQAVLKVLGRYEKIAVAGLAITETVFVLEKSLKLPRRQITAFIKSLLANQHIICNRPLLEKVLPLYADHPACSFNDICLAVYAELNGQAPLFTFDKKLAHHIKPAKMLQ